MIIGTCFVTKVTLSDVFPILQIQKVFTFNLSNIIQKVTGSNRIEDSKKADEKGNIEEWFTKEELKLIEESVDSNFKKKEITKSHQDAKKSTENFIREETRELLTENKSYKKDFVEEEGDYTESRHHKLLKSLEEILQLTALSTSPEIDNEQIETKDCNGLSNETKKEEPVNGISDENSVDEDIVLTKTISESHKSKIEEAVGTKDDQNRFDQSESDDSIQGENLKDIETLIISVKQSNSENTSNLIIEPISSEQVEFKQDKMRTDTNVRVLTLNHNEHQDSVLYRIEKNWILQFRLGPSLFGRKATLFCNYPVDPAVNLDFVRNCYYQLQWCTDEGCENSDDTASYAQIFAELSGSFHYYFTYDDSSEPQGSGFFIVDPVIKYGRNEELPADCIQCQTVLAKSLGQFSTWENKLRVAKESGYNMLHFTPIQELGASNSAYSLKEQLKLNPIFDDGQPTTFDEVEKLLSKLRTEWKIASICDIVLNHTANESKWLVDHPEVTYNCANCPYMRPAYLLDAALALFSSNIGKGYYETKGIPREVCTEDHLNAIRYVLHSEILPSLKLHEMYTCDVNKCVADFLSLARNRSPKTQSKPGKVKDEKELILIQDLKFRRLSSKVDMDLALALYNTFRHDCFDEETRLKKCGEDFKNKLEELNQIATNKLQSHLDAAIDNSMAGIRYFRVQQDGPRIKEVSLKNPIVFRYFTDYGNPKNVKEYEDAMYGEKSKFLMAHNGWVMNSDPLKNFAESDSNVYVRRELIAWGDSVKLRYGEKPEDCPFLWHHMRQYVEQTAVMFDGVRLDNCHSTPIPVAEYLLDCARKVKPDLYVVAELFTNSDQKDNIFVNRLGISSLIREAMSAWDSHEEGRLVYRYGGRPVGAFYQPSIRPLVPSIAHAIFFDVTHDNPSPVQKRSVFDMLPSTALVNMACCASGSNRGYDELVPHHIHVVDEKRQYTEWTDDQSLLAKNPRYVSRNSGIISAKRAIHDLHFQLGMNGYDQVYVDQMDADIVAVTRHNPETEESVVLVTFTAFNHPDINAAYYQRSIRPLEVEGHLDEIIFEATLTHTITKDGDSKYTNVENFDKDSDYVNGLTEYEVEMKQHIQLSDSSMLEWIDSGRQHFTKLNFKNFKPGSIVALKFSLPKTIHESVRKIRDLLISLSRNDNRELSQIMNKMSLADLNRTLYRCDSEERDEGNDFGAYNIPNFGTLFYCGLQGFMSLLENIRPNNDLGHPMCANLREGNWMIDYIWQRLQVDEGTRDLGFWLEKNTMPLKTVPRYLIPSLFDAILTRTFILLHEHTFNLMSDFVRNGSTFVKSLALGSVQFGAVIRSAPLPQLAAHIHPPKPPVRRGDKDMVQACVTLSAGLPHFTVGYTRNWGRDTFIALRGLFILTGRYDEARYIILAFGGCLRHGLIPNLLDGGVNARYNCRDAVWWWLYCIQCFVKEAPNGINILNDNVARLYPTDSSQVGEEVPEQKLQDVMQEALNVHFQGLVYRERNAGRQIDEHMTDKGFNVQIGVHPETGFVFGGNDANCGTWMDKMGSSTKAGNRGKPATPRDGSAVEIVALSKSTVTWLYELYENGQYAYDGVERVGKNNVRTRWTFAQWSNKIQENFEKHFWVNTEPVKDELRPDLINKRGIYKDCFGASQEWSDFQLRCNFPVAMVAAPELFQPRHAWIALQNAEKHLLGPLGIKTLDPDDWAYCGDYDNSNDSDDMKVAQGWNYHQGPEWVWPVGYFLRAKIHFAKMNGNLDSTISQVKVALSKHFTEIQTTAWKGLPELTNSNGSFCRDSCRTQAWSMSSILEVLHDLKQIDGQKTYIPN
ncbi:hypothetical protein Trydic_g18672 [Trypoxylus dichotomus]